MIFLLKYIPKSGFFRSLRCPHCITSNLYLQGKNIPSGEKGHPEQKTPSRNCAKRRNAPGKGSGFSPVPQRKIEETNQISRIAFFVKKQETIFYPVKKQALLCQNRLRKRRFFRFSGAGSRPGSRRTKQKEKTERTAPFRS